MQVFKCALRVVISHPIALFLYVVGLSLMGVFATGSLNATPGDEGFSAAKVPVAVIDRDHSELSQSLTAFLADNNDLVDVADDTYAMQNAVATGQVLYLLVIDDGYSDAFMAAARNGAAQPKLEATFSFATLGGRSADEQVNQYLSLARTAATLEPSASPASILARVDASAAKQAAIDTLQTPGSDKPADAFAFYLKWSTYTIVAAIVIFISLLMSAFNRTDVRRRTLVAPLSALRLGLQKALACLLVTAIAWIVVCAIGLAAYGTTLESVPPLAVALTLGCAFVFSLVPLSIGFLLGQLGVGEMAANAVGNIAAMVLSFMGGAWIGIELLPPGIQAFAHFLPAYWYNDAVGRALHLSDVAPSTVAPILGDLGIVALFAVALFAVALATGRVRQKSAEAGGNAAAEALPA